MARIHITPGTPTLSLPPSRRGQFSFTVTNNLGRAVRLQASIRPDDESEAKWLSIDGAVERDFAPAETETFLVQVQVPAKVPGGEHRFRLLVASVDHPDDEYDTSPEVAFTIPAVQPGSFPWWIAAVVGAVLLFAVGGFLLFRALQRPGLREPCNPAKANCRDKLACSPRDGGSVCLAELGAECRAGADCVTGVCEGSRDGGTGNVCGRACAPHAGAGCGSCGGTIQCDGTCSRPTPPDLGKRCDCGTMTCDGCSGPPCSGTCYRNPPECCPYYVCPNGRCQKKCR